MVARGSILNPCAARRIALHDLAAGALVDVRPTHPVRYCPSDKLPPMQESQHTEWKESWRDDYLRWVCGFANAEGGTLVIGRNDRGQAVGVANAARLLPS